MVIYGQETLHKVLILLFLFMCLTMFIAGYMLGSETVRSDFMQYNYMMKKNETCYNKFQLAEIWNNKTGEN